MRIRVHHQTRFRFDAPAKLILASLRLSPRNHEGQHVVSWRIDIDVDCRLKASEDEFGNITHVFNGGPIDAIAVQVEGEVETFDTAGVVRGTVERFPPEIFLRDTPMTIADGPLRAFADEVTDGATEPLAQLHALLAGMNERFALADGPGETTWTAGETLQHRRGNAVDLAHVFIGAARYLGIPARFVAGYFPAAETRHERPGSAHRDHGASVQTVPAHAWGEACVPGLGWVGFDLANGFCPQESHIRVAVGLDLLGAAPIRAAHQGVAKESVEATIWVRSAAAQPPT